MRGDDGCDESVCVCVCACVCACVRMCMPVCVRLKYISRAACLYRAVHLGFRGSAARTKFDWLPRAAQTQLLHEQAAHLHVPLGFRGVGAGATNCGAGGVIGGGEWELLGLAVPCSGPLRSPLRPGRFLRPRICRGGTPSCGQTRVAGGTHGPPKSLAKPPTSSSAPSLPPLPAPPNHKPKPPTPITSRLYPSPAPLALCSPHPSPV